MTHPTIGLGLVDPRPSSASAIARRMAVTATTSAPAATALTCVSSPIEHPGRVKTSANEAAQQAANRPRAASHPDFHRRSRSSTGSTGQSPENPQVLGRVADYHRRFGITPTPERTLLL